MSTLNSPTEGAGSPPPPLRSGTMTMASIPAGKRSAPPVHPGAVVADILEELDMSARALATAIGMSAMGVNQVVNGKTPITPGTALRLAALFGNTAEHWLDMQQEYDLWHARQELDSVLKKIKPVGLKRIAG